MTDWNLADCLDTVAHIRASRPALIQGDRTISWTAFDLHAQRIAIWLQKQGIEPHSQVALYCYNHTAYLETSYACLKASMVPVNINYRYKKDELLYLLENSDAKAIVVHVDFLANVRELLPQLPQLKCVIVVDEDEDAPHSATGIIEDGVAWARYGELIDRTGTPQPDSTRSGDDMVFIYTGGTTGMPKGVMWRQRDLYQTLGGGTVVPPPPTRQAFQAFIEEDPFPLRVLVLPPLMHGTAFFSSLVALLAGGTVILAGPSPGFDAAEAWRLVETHGANAMSIVGDTFARPLLRELQTKDYDISSLRFIASAGTLWSNKLKAGILEHHPDLQLFDGLGSSEAHNIGTSVTTVENVHDPVPRFSFGTNTLLVDERHQRLPLTPGTKGMIAVAGARPAGYYKDTKKSEATFLVLDGRDCTLSGDWAEVNADGETFTLLGRGSVCINTGGEKVFPEEVESTIKQVDGVVDAVVVGLPDEQWGEVVVGVVEQDPAFAVDSETLKAYVKSKLANYKAPKHIVPVDRIYRSPAGKADYAETRRIAGRALNLAVS